MLLGAQEVGRSYIPAKSFTYEVPSQRFLKATVRLVFGRASDSVHNHRVGSIAILVWGMWPEVAQPTWCSCSKVSTDKSRASRRDKFHFVVRVKGNA